MTTSTHSLTPSLTTGVTPTPTPAVRRQAVLLVTFGTGGDLEPFILLASGLLARGYRVRVVAPRNHEARLLNSGLPHTLFGSAASVEAVLDDPELWHERKGLGILARGLATGLDELVGALDDLAGQEACIAVCHPFMLSAAAIARQRRPDLRIVGAWLAPSNMRTIHDPLMIGSLPIPTWTPNAWRRALWRFVDRHWVDNVMLPSINQSRAVRGMTRIDHFFQHLAASCDASLGLFPSWFAEQAADWPRPFFQAGFPLAPAESAGHLPAEIDRFLAAGDAPVVVTFGTGMRHARANFDCVHRALRKLGRRGLFISPHRAQIPRELAPDMLWAAFAPFETLLPKVDAIVHHGGIGTTAQALRAGIAQLVVASGFDQFDNGARLRTLGVGDLLRATETSERRVRRRLRAVLTSASVRGACAAVARRFIDVDCGSIFIDRIEAALASSRAPA